MKIHKTPEGGSILIAEMTDDLLKDTIEKNLKGLKAAINIINAKVEETKKVDLIGTGLTVKAFRRHAEDNVKKILDELPFYIYEATIRGFNYTEQLQDIHERKTKSDYFAGMSYAYLASGY